MNGEHKPGEGAADTSATPGSGHGNERLVRLPEALQAVCLGRTAFLDLVKEGVGPKPVKIGRATFYVWSELQGFIAERIRLSRKG